MTDLSYLFFKCSEIIGNQHLPDPVTADHWDKLRSCYTRSFFCNVFYFFFFSKSCGDIYNPQPTHFFVYLGILKGFRVKHRTRGDLTFFFLCRASILPWRVSRARSTQVTFSFRFFVVFFCVALVEVSKIKSSHLSDNVKAIRCGTLQKLVWRGYFYTLLTDG